jgi:hypothetical protein
MRNEIELAGVIHRFGKQFIETVKSKKKETVRGTLNPDNPGIRN